MIEQLFLNAVEGISASRFWLMPLLLACVLMLLGIEVRRVFIDMLAEMKGDE
ncbi:MAG: hypothetical protein AB1427_00765 [Thermodesulfobacteriota bacterium]